MRKLSCWAIIAVLTIHMSIYSMDNKNNEIDFDIQETDDISQTSGRDSHQMSGNQSGNNPNCNFTNMADGMGGPVWDSTASYNLHDIVEWPSGSGHFWQSTTAGPTGEPSSNGKWIGPCDCAEISEISGIIWDANTAYDPWQIVDHNGSIWIAQDAGTNLGQEPVVGTDLWVMCEDSTPCDDLIGMTNIVVWDATMLVSEGEIYEYPANSGDFYMVAPFINDQTVGEPGIDLDAWDQEYCDCMDIWKDSGEPVWDTSTTYSVNSVVEHPSGSGDIWIATAPSTTAGVEPGQPWADGNEWELCGPEDNTSGGPCSELIGMANIAVWDTTTLVSEGEIYQYPANSEHFYMVAPFINNQTVGAPGIDLDAWDQEHCDCKDIWEDSGEPVWDTSTTYSVNSVVEHPSGSGDIWIAIAPSTTAGVEPGQPWADGNEWELCGPEDNTSGGPCDDLDVPVWDNTTTPVVGDIYEYPANSDTFYEIIFIHDDPNGGPGYINFPEETNSDEFWKPYNCPCKDTWVANGEPVWVSGTAYPGNYVVEHPANSGNLYIPLESGGVSVGGGEPGVDMHWVLCEGQEPSQSPCAGLDVIGVWDNSNVPVIGDIYEYPANSEEYWEIIFDHDGNISEPGSNGAEEFWAPVDCPCKETWVANGQPVWVSGTAYPGNYVVEHPAGSGNLYIPLESGGVSVGGGEPGIDMHWVLCDGQEPSQGPCDDLDYPVWDQTTVAAVGDIYEYPANSDNYYQVTYTDAGGMITTPPAEDQDYEFWTPYSCPCKDTWVANGQPVWDSTITNYAGNYVVEWPAGSGNLYISEGGGLSNSVEPGTDGHWIPCEGNEDVEDEATPDKEKSEEGSIPSIGAFATLLGIIAASAFVRREHTHE